MIHDNQNRQYVAEAVQNLHEGPKQGLDRSDPDLSESESDAESDESSSTGDGQKHGDLSRVDREPVLEEQNRFVSSAIALDVLITSCAEVL